jgi:hypothetical protein
VWVLDVTSDLGIPCFVTIAHWRNSQDLSAGSGAHFDPHRPVACRRAQSIPVHRSHGARPGTRRHGRANRRQVPAFRLQEHPCLLVSGKAAPSPASGSSFGRLDAREQVIACVALAQRGASISWCSIRPGPISRCRSCEVSRGCGISTAFAPIRLYEVRSARPAKCAALEHEPIRYPQT